MTLHRPQAAWQTPRAPVRARAPACPISQHRRIAPPPPPSLPLSLPRSRHTHRQTAATLRLVLLLENVGLSERLLQARHIRCQLLVFLLDTRSAQRAGPGNALSQKPCVPSTPTAGACAVPKPWFCAPRLVTFSTRRRPLGRAEAAHAARPGAHRPLRISHELNLPTVANSNCDPPHLVQPLILFLGSLALGLDLFGHYLAAPRSHVGEEGGGGSGPAGAEAILPSASRKKPRVTPSPRVRRGHHVSPRFRPFRPRGRGALDQRCSRSRGKTRRRPPGPARSCGSRPTAAATRSAADQSRSPAHGPQPALSYASSTTALVRGAATPQALARRSTQEGG